MDAQEPREAEEQARRLVDEYSDLILRLSYTYLKSTYDAEDICQNVLFKLMKTEKPFENPEHEKAWIIRTTANACKDLLRRSHRRATVALDAASSACAPEPPDSAVLDAVMALPSKYREAIYLYYFEGYTVREIATMTDRSEDAVNAHLSRGRKKLRATMKGELCGQGI